MGRPYAKLMVGSGDDERLAALGERNGLGGMMFFLSIPEAYPYGILPGSPRAYRAKVFAAAMIPDEQVQAAIDAQVEVGLLHRYEADGHVLLYIRNYHRYQEVGWTKVRPCEWPLPSCWTVPPELEALIEAGSFTKAKKRFGEYGVMGLSRAEQEALGQVPVCISKSPASGICEKQPGCIDVDVDVDVDLDVDVEEEGGAPPAPDSEFDTSSSLIESARAILGKLLNQPNGSAAIDAAIMAAIDVHPQAHEVLIQECGALATRVAQGEGVSVLRYLPANVREAAERFVEEASFLDDDDRLYARLVGPRPRGDFLKERTWDMERIEFRQSHDEFLWAKCHGGEWPSVRARAERLGLWDDALEERVLTAYRAQQAAEESA